MNRWLLAGALLFLGLFVAGCGGGAVVSGPDPQTSPGRGTLIVSVSGAGDDGVAFIEKLARPTRRGRAYFYDIAPGRYLVSGSLLNNGSYNGSDEREVDILANKTVRITLYPVDPFATPTQYPLKKRNRAPQ